MSYTWITHANVAQCVLGILNNKCDNVTTHTLAVLQLTKETTDDSLNRYNALKSELPFDFQ